MLSSVLAVQVKQISLPFSISLKIMTSLVNFNVVIGVDSGFDNNANHVLDVDKLIFMSSIPFLVYNSILKSKFPVVRQAYWLVKSCIHLASHSKKVQTTRQSRSQNLMGRHWVCIFASLDQ